MLKCHLERICGGCDDVQTPYHKQLQNKQKMIQGLWPAYKVQPIIGMDDPYHYRHKVIAAFGYDEKGKIIAGSFQKHSHRIVNRTCECLLEEEELQAVVRTIGRLMERFALQPYDEDEDKGLIRYALLRKGYVTQQILVVLVVSSFRFPHQEAFVRELKEAHPHITSVVLNQNRRHTSAVLGQKEKVIDGTGTITDVLCGCRFRISASSFYQVNPVQTERLYRCAIDAARLTPQQTVLDAYCGIGTIGMIAAARAKEVIGVEVNEAAIRDAIGNAKRNDLHNIHFFAADASAYMTACAKRHISFDTVLMDPPRSGASLAFMKALVRMAPQTIVYISCGPETQRRDIAMLLKQGYRVRMIQPVDMFPFTEHVETIALLQKSNWIFM